MSHVVEGVRQLMGRGEARQAHKDLNYAFINNNGGGLSVEASWSSERVLTSHG